MSVTELKEVSRKLRSTAQIRRVTTTLQRVAAARGPADRAAIDGAERYLAALDGALREALAAVPGDPPALLRAPPPGGAVSAVVFGTDRGLCGGFNAALLEAAQRLAAAAAPRPFRCVAIGRVFNRRALRAGLDVERFEPQPPRGRAGDLLDRLAEAVLAPFAGGHRARVDLVYMRVESMLRQAPRVEPLLPAPLAPAPRGPWTAFEPHPAALLAESLPEYVRQRLAAALAHSLAAENLARQLAMARATDNAGRLLTDLRRRYSRLRQDMITTEMIELSGGTAAVAPGASA